MERFTQRIIGILRKSNVSCGYKAPGKTIYAYRKEQYGEIFSFYCLFGKELNNLTIYSLAIPQHRQEDVLKYLSVENRAVPNSYFFIDHRNNYIVFNALYNFTDEQEIINDGCFVNFCIGGYEFFHKYQDNIYAFATVKD